MNAAPAPSASLGPRQWHRVFGEFSDYGLSIDWQEFDAQGDSRSTEVYEEGCLELCFNLEGAGEIHASSNVVLLHAYSLNAYLISNQSLEVRRYGGQKHRYLRLRIAPGYLREILGDSTSMLLPWVRDFIAAGSNGSSISVVHQPIPLALGAERLFKEIVDPPVVAAAAELWYRGKVMELMARCLCEQKEPEFFCSRQKRLAMERVERASAILRNNLEEPPSLGELGRMVGCSPSYLSRTFSGETGMTVSQFIRQVRIEKAAELLQGGRKNVTEVATEVGYSSLSHFSKAFREVTGCCPGLYPIGAPAVLPARMGS